MIYQITSKDNRRVIEAAKLQMAKYQKTSGLFLVEGYHLLEMAIKHQAVQYVFATKEIPSLNVDQYIVSDEILAKLAASKNPQGVVAVCKEKQSQNPSSNGVIYLDDVSDPGNLGTILRTALAFGYMDVILSENCVSPYNDKAISASQGAIFGLNLISGDANLLKQMKENGYQLVATSLYDSVPLEEAAFKEHHVILLGNESRGLSPVLLSLADIRTRISISEIESLNVAVAAGIVLYEASRKLK